MKMNSRIKKLLSLLALVFLTMSFNVHAKNAMHIVVNDHLGTSQMLINENKHVVWKANYDEFGKAHIQVEEVEFNLRFPGQYYDKETGLNYNYYRDYDSSLGRYVQSDPIGLEGGINTYAYALGSPVMNIDFFGLETYQCTKPLHVITEKYGASAAQVAHDYVPYAYHQYSCVIRDGKIECGGQDRTGSAWSSDGKPSQDTKDGGQCKLTEPDNDCFEKCLKDEWAKPRPRYGIPFGKDCQNYDDDVNSKCRKECKTK